MIGTRKQWLGNAEQNCLLVFREVVAPVTYETHSEFPYSSIYTETWTLWPHNAKDICINKTMASLCNIFQIHCTIWHFSSPFVNYFHCQYPQKCSLTCVYYFRKRLLICEVELCPAKGSDSFVYGYETKLRPAVSCILLSQRLAWRLHIGTLSYVKRVAFCKYVKMELFLGETL